MSHLPPRRRFPLASAWGVLWLSIRRLRAEPVIPLVMLLTIATASAALAAAPRLTNRAADAEVRAALAAATPIQRNLQVAGVMFPGQPEEDVDTERQVVLDVMPPTIRALVHDSGWALQLPQFVTSPPTRQAYAEPGKRVFLQPAINSGIAPHLRLVEGQLPGAGRCECGPNPRLDEFTRPPPGSLLVIPVAISQPQATFLHWNVGDEVPLEPDTRDRLGHVFGNQVAAIHARVVGIFEVANPTEEYWFADARFVDVAEGENDVRLSVLIGSGGLADLNELWPTGMNFAVNYTLSIDQDLDADAARILAHDARQMLRNPALREQGGPVAEIRVRTSLPQILDRADSARRQAESILLIALMGIGSVAVTTLALVAVLLVARRRPAAAILRSRGSARVQLLLPQGFEALGVGLLGSGLGWMLATQLIPARDSSLSRPAALAVGVAAIAAWLVVAVRQARRGQQALERDERPVRRLAPRRLVAEGLVVAGALAGLLLIGQRGFAVSGAGPDPFLAVAPGLAGLALGLALVRIYPLPVALAARLAARSRRLVAALGLTRAARNPEAASLPLVAALLAAAMASFAGLVTASVDHAQELAAWRALGADVVVRWETDKAGPGTADLRNALANIPGVEHVAGASVTASVPFSILGAGGGSVSLIGVDAAGLEQVTNGTPVPAQLPSAFVAQTGDGSTAHPIPAITPPTILGTTTAFSVGAGFSMAFDGVAHQFIVAGIRDGIPGIASGAAWMVVPQAGLEAALGQQAPPVSMLLVRSPTQASAVATTVRERAPTASVETRAEAMDRLRQAPLAGAITNGFGLAALLAAAFAAAALVIGLAITAPDRARDTARLRTLGISRLQILGLAFIEQLPAVLIALAAGGAFGIAIGRLMLPSIDLTAVTGGERTVEIVTDLTRTAVLLGAVLLVLLVGLLGAVLADSRRQLGRALRVGDE